MVTCKSETISESPPAVSESPPATEQQKKVSRDSSRYTALSLYSSLGICFGHSQWHTRPAKLSANPVGQFSHSEEHSLHTSLPKLFCSTANSHSKTQLCSTAGLDLKPERVLFVLSCKIYPRICLIIHTHTAVKKNKPSKQNLFKTEEIHDTVQRESTWLMHVYWTMFLQPIHLMELSTLCQFLSRCPCKYFSVTAFKSNQD